MYPELVYFDGAHFAHIAARDEHFRIESDAGRDAVGLLPPELLQAMLARTIPAWACRAGELVVWENERFETERVDTVLPAVGRLVDLIGTGGGQWREAAPA